MRPAAILILLLCATSTGCTTVRLRQRTMNQGGTLPELQYQQVLDNLALFATNPASLPWHVNLQEGTTQITDSISGGAVVDLGPPAALLPELFGSRTAVAQWGMAPVTNPTELRLLRFAYRRASGRNELPDPEFLDGLAHELKNQFPSNPDLSNESILFYDFQRRDNPTPKEFQAGVVTANGTNFCAQRYPAAEQSPLVRNTCREVEAIQQDLARITPGWFHTGGRRDVPKNACFVGRSGDSYSWVCPEGREQLTEFTLTILKFSSLVKDTQTLVSPGSVKFSPGDRG